MLKCLIYVQKNIIENLDENGSTKGFLEVYHSVLMFNSLPGIC